LIIELDGSQHLAPHQLPLLLSSRARLPSRGTSAQRFSAAGPLASASITSLRLPFTDNAPNSRQSATSPSCHPDASLRGGRTSTLRTSPLCRRNRALLLSSRARLPTSVVLVNVGAGVRRGRAPHR
jgi:hypothetical protein